MGNDHSQLSKIEINNNPVEVSNFWSQYSAKIDNSENLTNLSVFVENSLNFKHDRLWASQTPLQRCAKVLLLLQIMSKYSIKSDLEFEDISSSMYCKIHKFLAKKFKIKFGH